jgi:hypothetical protein
LKKGDIKIMVDMVARDYLGYPIAAASLHIENCISAEEAEAREHELKVTRVESDCATAVKSTNCLKPNTSGIIWSVYRTSATQDLFNLVVK